MMVARGEGSFLLLLLAAALVIIISDPIIVTRSSWIFAYNLYVPLYFRAAVFWLSTACTFEESSLLMRVMRRPLTYCCT